MKEELATLKEKFQTIQKLGYIKSTRKGPTGVGKTFEDLLEKKEDHVDLPDYNGIEIKTKLELSKSYTTLFNATPLGKNEYEIKRLQMTYGYPDKTMRFKKVLQNSVYANEVNSIANKYLFRLKVDYKEEKIFLQILDKSYKLIEQESYWPFEILEKRLNQKLNYLAFVKASKRKINQEVYYKYYQMDYYKLKDFKVFLSLLEKGVIRVTFHIGVFKSGSRYGEIHDRGTSFEIKEQDLLKLFDEIKE